MSIITTFEHQCRALTTIVSPDENASRFLVGTQSPKGKNLIYLFEYKDDNNNLAKVSYKFPYGESWHLSTSSKHPNLMTGVIGNDGKLGISLFKLPQELENPIEDDYGLSESNIDKVADFNDEVNNPNRQSHWHPEDGDKLLTCSDLTLKFWDINEESKVLEFHLGQAIARSSDPAPDLKSSSVTDLRWSSLFNCSVVAAAIGSRIYGIDTRISDSSPSSLCWLIEDNKCNKIHSVDFNPNSQYYLASGGDNCRANFWDLRQVTCPSLHLKSHTHWIWSIRYNPYHDQLVLSAGSDARVSLMRVQSIASEPFGQVANYDEDEAEPKTSVGDETELDTNCNDKIESKNCQETTASTENDPKCPRDEVINLYEEHDDSVYAAEWATDPWIFASLGFESRLVINKVPKSEKFSILF